MVKANAKQASLGVRSRRQGQFGQVMHRLAKNKLAMLGLFVMLALILVALLSPWITPYDYATPSKADRYALPSAQHWFGCDGMGRDIFSRILYGARASLWLGLMSTLVSTVIGVVLGSLVGYFGGWVDTQYQGSAWRSSGEGCWTLRLQYAFQKRYGRNT